MKKWIGIGVVFLLVLTVTGIISFNNKVEKSQAEVEKIERDADEKKSPDTSELEAADPSEQERSVSQGDERKGKEESVSSQTEVSYKDVGFENMNKMKALAYTNRTSTAEGQKQAADQGKSENPARSNTSSQSPGSSSNSPESRKENEGKSDSNRDTASSENASEQPSSGKSANAILNQYEAEFRAMESNYQGQLNSLVQEAYDEYMTEGTVSKSEYKSRAAGLEGKADSAFYGKYNQLQSELKRNGLDPSLAVPFKNEYESKKASRRAELESLAE